MFDGIFNTFLDAFLAFLFGWFTDFFAGLFGGM
jgi:hypothetical protein